MFRILSRTMPDLRAEITSATTAYFAQANHLTLTATDLYDWLATLPTARRERVLHTGFATSRAEPDFLRYCLELRGYSMRSFLAEELSVAAYALWAAHGEHASDLAPQ
ncbi:hypothetical protein [Hymenobacter setariae]|nr:hypothetical protein [Hymenobacter setariae]